MSLAGLVEFCQSSPLDWFQWLPAQDAYLKSERKRRCLRAGNQAMGKTTVGCAEIIYRALGWHPRKAVPRAPVHWWVLSSSERSSGILQGKLWDLVPRNEVDPSCWYDPSKGAFVGKYPLCRFRNGSIVEFRWTGSRTLNLASASLDGVWIDEPPSKQRAFSEIERRLTRTGGDMLLTLTPVNAPVAYLRELCEKGKIEDLHFSLRPENLIPVGRSRPISTEDGVPMDEAWIAEQRELVASWEAPVILDGEWEFRAVGAAFDAWDPARFVVSHLPLPSRPLRLSLGTDYGGQSLRQVSILVAVDDSGDYPVIYILDEYVADGPTTIEEDAQAVIDMLTRNGIAWHELDYAYGDKRWVERRRGGGLSKASKDNEDFQVALEDRLHIKRGGLRPAMRNAKRGAGQNWGSVERGTRFIHQAMVRRDGQHLYVSRRAPILAEALGRWDWTEEMKDPVDALRYALKPWIYPIRNLVIPSTVRIAR